MSNYPFVSQCDISFVFGSLLEKNYYQDPHINLIDITILSLSMILSLQRFF